MDCCVLNAVSPVPKGSHNTGRGTAMGCGEGDQRENTSRKDWVNREGFFGAGKG